MEKWTARNLFILGTSICTAIFIWLTIDTHTSIPKRTNTDKLTDEVVLGSISSPFAMVTGLFTWWINYRLKLTPFVKRKIQFSVLLLIFEIILWRSMNQGVSNPIYVIMMLLLTPIVILLGYYGGQMTFPSEKPL